jgi:predicted nucleic acid-binding protein
MKKIFLDTCGILALVNKRDQLHERALEVNQTLKQKETLFFLSDYIIAEVGNALFKNKKLAIRTLDFLLSAEDIQLIQMNEILFLKTLKIYKKFFDKNWGFTDISSFVIMENYKIEEVFAKDKHFQQFGFRNLL